MDKISLTDESIVSLAERNNRLIIVEASRYIVNSGNCSTYLSRIPVIDNSQTCVTIKGIIYNSGVIWAKEKCEEVYKNRGM